MQDVNQWMSSLGFVGQAELNGKVHRVDRDSKKGRSAWYVGWKDPVTVVIAGDWRTGEKWEFKDSAKELSPEERRRVKLQVRAAMAQAEKERQDQRQAAALKADIMLRSAGEVGSHPYLERKRLPPFDLKALDSELLIPVNDIDGKLWGLERITGDGKKLFLPGQRVEGCFYQLGSVTQRVYIAEGYATAATIHLATRDAVFCAFYANNLSEVARAVRRKYPGAEIVIAGDDDRFTQGNPGRTKATEAAAGVNGTFLLPCFLSDEGKPTDFNDLHVGEGLDAVKRQLERRNMDEGKKDNLVSIKSKERKQRSEGDAKVKSAEVYRSLSDVINGVPTGLPKFPRDFKIVQMAKGGRVITEVGAGDTLEVIPLEEAVSALMLYCDQQLDGMDGFCLTYRMALEATVSWRSRTEPLGKVPYTRWLTEEGYCWRRVPFDLTPDPGEHMVPTWQKLLTKIESAAARESMMAWIGSLFFADSYRQQYVWIYGPGGNGKGCIGRFLHGIFGPCSHFLSNVPREPNQFWTAQFLNRRLVVIPDCENHAFPASGLFKTLAGGDPITIEQKHGQPYTAILDAKFLYTSNQLPSLSSENADMRRAILVRMEGNGTWESDFEAKLWAEGGAFLWHCITTYARLCPDHGPIQTDSEDLLNWVSTLEEVEEVVFEKWFRVDPAGFVVPGDMAKVLETEWPRRRKPQVEFIKWLERTHGVRKVRIRLETDLRQNRYQGISLVKPPSALSESAWTDLD